MLNVPHYVKVVRMRFLILKKALFLITTCAFVFNPWAVVFSGDSLTMEANWDRPGFDYKNFWLEKDCPECCRDACAKDPKCKAFTYGVNQKVIF